MFVTVPDFAKFLLETVEHFAENFGGETLRFCILVIANLSGSNQSQTLTENLFGYKARFQWQSLLLMARI